MVFMTGDEAQRATFEIRGACRAHLRLLGAVLEGFVEALPECCRP